DRKVAVLKHSYVDDRVLLEELPNHRADNGDAGNYRKGENEVGLQPVVALSLVENHLKAAQPYSHQRQPDVVDFDSRIALLSEFRRIFDKAIGEEQRDDRYWNVDEENPAPIVVIGDPATECGADCGRQHHGHAIDRESHATFPWFESVGEDCLFAGSQSAATNPLQHAKEDEQGKAGSKSAKQRTKTEQCDASHVEALASHHVRSPSADWQYYCVRDQIRGEHPGAFVGRGREAAGNVRQSDVGDASVEHLHEGRHRD